MNKALEATAVSGRSAPSAIIFDWDNTLVDTWPTIHDAMNHTLVHFEMTPWSMAETRNKVRKSMRDSFPDLFGSAWRDAADVFYGRYQEIHMAQLVPLSGAEDMLETVGNRGIFMSVVSNKRGDYLRAEVGHLGWDKYLSNLVGAGDAERDKPATDPVLLALSGSGIRPDQSVWFVGDANIDLECGINAGCVPVLIRENAPSTCEFDDFPPHYYVKNCSKFKDLVARLSA